MSVRVFYMYPGEYSKRWTVRARQDAEVVAAVAAVSESHAADLAENGVWADWLGVAPLGVLAWYERSPSGRVGLRCGHVVPDGPRFLHGSGPRSIRAALIRHPCSECESSGPEEAA